MSDEHSEPISRLDMQATSGPGPYLPLGQSQQSSQVPMNPQYFTMTNISYRIAVKMANFSFESHFLLDYNSVAADWAFEKGAR